MLIGGNYNSLNEINDQATQRLFPLQWAPPAADNSLT